MDRVRVAAVSGRGAAGVTRRGGGGGMGLRGWVGGTGPDSGRFEGDAPRLAVSDRSYAMKRLFPLVRARMSTRSGSHGSSAACSGSYHRRHIPTSTAGQDACAYP